ncbi:ferric reductase-like transmembrane domain-containing protein [Paraurantiacibacter namhicola]|uniref:Sulfoxide reductase heme-binding subunit YedZ n=1 Tax=Paraurantiacibacter namhicola TaxID=645517 RepID=A0A1C7D4W1_9SPHN|nr:ferric reductase-like transmembrane domain-containing protein [Paraurantiacibacter namhicola]ANU06507.1 Sulfoxide reductase heme-binding subunit YedZ [Paraurantiacibacter namhicola]
MGLRRPLLWLLLALPGGWIFGRWGLTPDTYGYGNAVADSGDWAAWLLMAAMAVTPLRLMTGRAAWTGWLLKRRRDLGVASFAYAALHLGIYLWRKGPGGYWIDEFWEPWLLAGWAGFALFVPLAITSNDASMKALKRGWKRLHRLVYPAAVLVFSHWIMSAFNPLVAWINAGILLAIELARVVLQARARSKA